MSGIMAGPEQGGASGQWHPRGSDKMQSLVDASTVSTTAGTVSTTAGRGEHGRYHSGAVPTIAGRCGHGISIESRGGRR